jgi:uncharacterized protein YjbI with pentapeptide repeats
MADFNLDADEYLSETFAGLDRARSEIDGVLFEGCRFESCDFSEVVFRACSFIDCSFSSCNLSVADIGYSRFVDVRFEDCKLIGVDWTRGDWPRLVLHSPFEFRHCVLDGGSFFGMKLAGLVLERCRAQDVDFQQADLSRGNFSGTDFTHSQFGQTNLGRANFCDATGYRIDINSNFIGKARFSRLEALSLLDSLDIELLD